MIKKVVIAAFFTLTAAPLAQAVEVTANVNLQRGTILEAQDLKIDVGSHESREDVLSVYIGKELMRTVSEGYKLNPSYVRKPVAVRRNERVSMIYRAGPMEITAWGRALEEGSVGDVISVMNLDSRKRIQGRILESGRIEVGL